MLEFIEQHYFFFDSNSHKHIYRNYETDFIYLCVLLTNKTVPPEQLLQDRLTENDNLFTTSAIQIWLQRAAKETWISSN